MSEVILSVVIPAYNESAVIAELLTKVSSYLDTWGQSYEIIVADDGSSDQTATIVKSFENVRLLSLSHGGKGWAVQQGVLAARGQYYLFMDADNSTDISHLPAFWEAIRHNDIVIASRQLDSSDIAIAQPRHKQLLGKLGNRLIQWFLVPGIKDTQCGFKMFRADCRVLFEQQRRHDWAFDFELLFLARKRGLTICELPVRWVNNFDTKVKPFAYITTLLAVFSVQYNYWTHKYHL